jgi:YVTN family beta-propeller protein
MRLVWLLALGTATVPTTSVGQYCAYVASLPLSVVDTATNTVVATIDLPGATNATAVAFKPDGTRAYVTDYSGFVSVIDTATRTVIATVPTQGSSIGIAVSPNGAAAWVANFITPGSVSLIDTATNSITNFGVWTPYNVGFTPDGTRAYVTNTGNFVSVVDTASHTVIATVPVSSTGTRSVAITPDGTRAYVSLFDSSRVAVIDTASNSVLTNIPVGPGPDEGVAITPDGAFVYALFSKACG